VADLLVVNEGDIADCAEAFEGKRGLNGQVGQSFEKQVAMSMCVERDTATK
jgi:hypothetical protein